MAVADINFCLCSLAGEHVWRMPNERRSGGLCVAKFVHVFVFVKLSCCVLITGKMLWKFILFAQ